MSVSAKPSWLAKPEALAHALQFNVSVPLDVGSCTSLVDTTGFTHGVRQFFYWRGQLLPSLTPNTVFLAFLGPKGLVQPNVFNVYKGLQALCDMSQLLEINTGANANFLALSFSSAGVVDKIISQYSYSDDTVVLHVAESVNAEYRFRLLWLPPLFSVARVHHLLESFSLSHRIHQESIVFDDGFSSSTNVVSGVLTLAEGKSVNDLPYLIRLPTPHKGCALLSISGRQQICLKCRALGHVRSQCSMIRCSSCGKVHFPNAACGASSYSSVASRNVTSFSSDAWLDSLPDLPASSGLNSLNRADGVEICHGVSMAVASGSSVFGESHPLIGGPHPCDLDVASVLTSSLLLPVGVGVVLAEGGHTVCLSSELETSPDVSLPVASCVDDLPSGVLSPSLVGGAIDSCDFYVKSSKSSLLAGVFAEAASSSEPFVNVLPSIALKRKSCDALIDSSGSDETLCTNRSQSLKRKDCGASGALSLHSSPSGMDLHSPSALFLSSNVGDADVSCQLSLPSNGLPVSSIALCAASSSSFQVLPESSLPLLGEGDLQGSSISSRSRSASSVSSSGSASVDFKSFYLLLSGFPFDTSDDEVRSYMDAHSYTPSNEICVPNLSGDRFRVVLLQYCSLEDAERDLLVVPSSYNQFPLTLTLLDDDSVYSKFF